MRVVHVVKLVGSDIPLNPHTLKRVVLVLIVSTIIVTSLVITDVTVAGFEHDVSEPELNHDFPETIYFYNISEGVTGEYFGIIFDIPVNHSGHHHIIPRELSLLFCFRDNVTGADLSSFIWGVDDSIRNGTFSYNLHDYDRFEKYVDGWWMPTHLRFVLNDRPDVFLVKCGILFELIVVNHFGDFFDGHQLDIQLRMNVTYSRWWNTIQVSQAHQTIEYVFDFTDNGVVDVQSLDYL
jgi:hypothetical protein